MKSNLKFSLVITAAFVSSVAFSSAAFAQSNRQNTTVNAQVGVFPLPQGVNRMLALEHNNSILTETKEDDGSKCYASFQLKHISPRAFAYIFGATVIPTEALVMPPAAMNGGFGNNGGNFGFPGNNGGFNNGGNGGFNNGFNNGFQGGGNGFMFPQSNNFGNGFNNGVGSGQPVFNNGNANLGNFPQNTPFPNNQAGLGIGTPVGNFFAPAQTTN